MHLVDYEHAVSALTRGYLHLLNELTYVVHTVVGGGVKLDYVQRVALIECAA